MRASRCPSGRRLSVIDVPGHERFVRTMVAGATGIDLYLMTVAADDGVMPQTREHAAVLEALGVRAGVVAVTKSDLPTPRSRCSRRPSCCPTPRWSPVSARTGDGLHELRAALDRVAGGLASRAGGAGAARGCTSTARSRSAAPGRWSPARCGRASIGRGDELVVLPGDRRVRVRGVQVHDQPLERAAAGQRVALNLTGVAVDEVAPRRRGRVARRRTCDPAYLLDAELQFGGEDPEHGDRVQIHHGTREAPARLAWLGGRFWQVRLEQPLVAAAGDRLVVRQIAPPDTIGGGRVLDPRPRKHGPSRDLLTRLERLSRGEPAEPPPQRRARGADGARAGAPRSLSRSRPRRSLWRSVCARPGSSRRWTPNSTPPTWPLCAMPGKPLESPGRCTTTPMCWRTCAGG